MTPRHDIGYILILPLRSTAMCSEGERRDCKQVEWWWNYVSRKFFFPFQQLETEIDFFFILSRFLFCADFDPFLKSLTRSYCFLQFLKCDHEQNGWIEMGIVKNEWEVYSKSEVIKISVLCSSSGAANTHTPNSWNNATRFIRFRWLAAFSRRQTMLYLYQIASEVELVINSSTRSSQRNEKNF